MAHIDIPNSVTEVGRDAFEGCTSLESICLPNSERYSIEASVFRDCTSLKSIHSAVENIDDIEIEKKPFRISISTNARCMCLLGHDGHTDTIRDLGSSRILRLKRRIELKYNF